MMNSFFRRDYLYKFRGGSSRGLQADTLFRYLEFDRKTRQYIFIEGARKHQGELRFRIDENRIYTMLNRTQKVRCIGYDETDRYLGKGAYFKATTKVEPLNNTLENTELLPWELPSEKEVI